MMEWVAILLHLDLHFSIYRQIFEKFLACIPCVFDEINEMFLAKEV